MVLGAVMVLGAAVGRAQMVMTAKSLVEAEQQHGSSGTSVEPPSTAVPMLMTERDGWRLMLHGNGFVADTQQQAGSERGRDAAFSTNWMMPMAQRKLGPGTLTVRAMFSLEPATVTGREYPELFQQGETAFGAPIVDGQHPHDFFMEVAALYDLPLAKDWLLSVYAAPVGDPAVGPTAYPHRMSASEDPLAALGHHQEDSTHIAFNVVTGGVTYKWARLELSGFHGGEPSEQRWGFEPSVNGHAMDSVATRLTLAPGADWAGQYSVAHIHSPEALYPNEDQQRQTWGAGAAATGRAAMGMAAMGMESEPRRELSSTVVWGRTKSLTDGSKENSYLAEALLRFASRNYAWTRMEDAGRSNELELTPGQALPLGFAEKPVGHVAAFSFGYDRDFALGRHLLAAPGAQVTVYRTPQALRGIYGDAPTGEVVFVRLRLR
jgi:hypothetical protein